MDRSGYVDEDPEIEWTESKHVCSECGESIQYCDETFCVGVVFTLQGEHGIVYQPSIHDEDGDYKYEPCFFCFQCGESVLEEVRERVQDIPPLYDEHSIASCHVCESGIRHGEVVGLMVHGEIHVSKRHPDSNYYSGDTFAVMDDNPSRLCISCINVANEITDLWGEDERITQHLECREGSSARCWRRGCLADGSCSVG